jgi:hypothetical protein
MLFNDLKRLLLTIRNRASGGVTLVMRLLAFRRSRNGSGLFSRWNDRMAFCGQLAMKPSVSMFLLLAVCLGECALNAEQRRVIVSVLSPMAYGPNCWSNVELQNLGTRDVAVNVEGHKGSGALVALVGSPSVLLTVALAQKVTLRLQVPGEESPEGWVRVSETIPAAAQGAAIAVSGQTECLADDKLTTVPQTVAFPTRNPWFTADVKDLRERSVMILNVSDEAATAKACYSSGTTVSLSRGSGTGGDPILVCIETLLLQIPPFGTTTVPVARGGNSQFSIKTRGESLVLRVLLPQSGGMKTYTVDSTVKFGQPLDGRPR